MNTYIIDRMEGDFAICETDQQEMIEIPVKRLPANSKEGDSIIILEDGNIIYDENRTKERKKHIKELLDRLYE